VADGPGLPGDALVELVVRCGRGPWLDLVLPCGRPFPPWWTVRGREGGRLTEMDEKVTERTTEV
jgi:hypothetical protein